MTSSAPAWDSSAWAVWEPRCRHGWLTAGHTVIGYDVSEQARQRLAAAGGHDQTALADVAKGARLVILMLPDSDAVASVLEDADLLERMEPGAIVVDMSSSEPLRTRALAESLENVPSGCSMLPSREGFPARRRAS